MPAIEQIGAAIALWGAVTLIFMDWILRLDLAFLERLTGVVPGEDARAQQRDLLEGAGRRVVVAGLLVLGVGAVLRIAGVG